MNNRIANTLSIGAVIFLLLQAVIMLLSYNALPAEMPSHLSWSGELSNIASKSRIWQLLLTSAVIYLILTVVIKSGLLDRNYNYNNFTPETEAALISSGRTTILIVRAASTLIFLLVTVVFLFVSLK